jgi:hypothetical protein
MEDSLADRCLRVPDVTGMQPCVGDLIRAGPKWCRGPDVTRLLLTAGDLRPQGNGSIGPRRYDVLCIAWPVPKEASR